MNLGELASGIYSSELKDQDAFNMFMASMEATSKVYKNAKVVLPENEQQNKVIQAFIEDAIKDCNKQTVMWHGVYRGDAKPVANNPAEVEYWYFMHSLLVIRRPQENKWGFCYPVTKKKLMQLAQSVEAKPTGESA